MRKFFGFIKSLELGILIALIAIAFVSFVNTLDNPFLIDDHAFFDEKLKNPKYVWLHFLPDKNKILHIEGESADPFYRPLATIIPMLMHLSFRDNVVGYHASNTVLFALAGWMLFLFIRFLGGGTRLAFLAAVFYIVHPINGVVVNYITASVFAAQMILMLGSLFCLMRFYDGREKREEGRNEIDQRQKTEGQGRISSVFRRPSSIVPRLSSLGWLVSSLLLYLLAAFCHETAMALPFYAFVLIAVFRSSQDEPMLSSENLKRAFLTVLPLFLMLGAYFVFRMTYSSLDASILNKIQRYDMNFAQYLSTWTMLLWWYLSRLFYPDGIVLIMAHQPLKDIGPIAGWIAVLILTIASGVGLLRHYRRDRFAFFGLLLFILGFGPYTLACFFQPIHGLMIEPHWFLFPAMGFFIFLARVIEQLKVSKSVLALVLGLLLVPWMVMGWRHNHIWGDEVRYCKWWLAKSPDFVAVNAYIAKAYELRKEFDKARAHYSTVLGRKYKAYIAYTNMGLMDLQEEKWDSAKQNFKSALELDPRASVTISNLGAIAFKDGNFKEALEYFERCKELDRFAILPRLNISKVYLKMEDPKRAAQTLEDALEIVPYHEIALVNLIKIYIDQKDKDNILKVAKWILERSQNPNALNNVAIIFKSYGQQDLSREATAKARKFIER